MQKSVKYTLDAMKDTSYIKYDTFIVSALGPVVKNGGYEIRLDILLRF